MTVSNGYPLAVHLPAIPWSITFFQDKNASVLTLDTILCLKSISISLSLCFPSPLLSVCLSICQPYFSPPPAAARGLQTLPLCFSSSPLHAFTLHNHTCHLPRMQGQGWVHFHPLLPWPPSPSPVTLEWLKQRVEVELRTRAAVVALISDLHVRLKWACWFHLVCLCIFGWEFCELW